MVKERRPDRPRFELVPFTWERGANARAVIDERTEQLAAHNGERCGLLAEQLTADEGERYSPFAEDGLFCEFAHLPDDSESVRAFVEKYGLLGLPNCDRREPVHWLMSERRAMALALGLWESLRDGEPERVIGGPARDQSHLSSLRVADKLALFCPDVSLPLWALAQNPRNGWGAKLGKAGPEPLTILDKTANKREQAQAVLTVLVTRASRYFRLAPTLVPDGKVYGAGLRLSWQVDSLIGALWLQLILAVDGNRKYKKCCADNCGKWWDASNARDTRNYCSEGKCRERIKYMTRKAGPRKSKAGDVE